ncbi:AMP-binding protein [Microbulbifer variabilis]|uniref:AMP-binding protein n=1 Tax=Microbulbifer variabilis TaxID=266805 RepID=UPI001CFE8A39|nr:AMP-binding protein [Microbulbifer variabilis]
MPDSATRIEDLSISSPKEILQITRSSAQKNGAIIMSSGGTTGKPKLTYTPFHQASERLMREWHPIGPGSVVLNLFNPGRLWGAHYLIQTLAEKSKAITVPSGPYRSNEVDNWLETFQQIGVNTLAGNPTVLAEFAQGLLDTDGSLDIESIVWTGERWTETKYETVCRAFPSAGFWGVYGSVETWMIAVNSPKCDRDTLHLLADQLIEPDNDGGLLTRIGEGWTVPVVRYRLGDRIKETTCRCGRANALLIKGRVGDSISLHSALIDTGMVIELAEQEQGVEEAQLILSCEAGAPIKEVNIIRLTFTGSANPEKVRKRVLDGIHNLASVAHMHPEFFTAQREEQLRRVERTNKVPPVIWDIKG